jgi:hypothetical protein
MVFSLVHLTWNDPNKETVTPEDGTWKSKHVGELCYSVVNVHTIRNNACYIVFIQLSHYLARYNTQISFVKANTRSKERFEMKQSFVEQAGRESCTV